MAGKRHGRAQTRFVSPIILIDPAPPLHPCAAISYCI